MKKLGDVEIESEKYAIIKFKKVGPFRILHIKYVVEKRGKRFCKPQELNEYSYEYYKYQILRQNGTKRKN